MPKSTTIKVSVSTRDALRQLADREGLTLDAQLDRLVRRELSDRSGPFGRGR